MKRVVCAIDTTTSQSAEPHSPAPLLAINTLLNGGGPSSDFLAAACSSCRVMSACSDLCAMSISASFARWTAVWSCPPACAPPPSLADTRRMSHRTVRSSTAPMGPPWLTRNTDDEGVTVDRVVGHPLLKLVSFHPSGVSCRGDGALDLVTLLLSGGRDCRSECEGWGMMCRGMGMCRVWWTMMGRASPPFSSLSIRVIQSGSVLFQVDRGTHRCQLYAVQPAFV